MKSKTTLALGLLALLTASSAHAHDTWLIPDHFEIAPNSKVALDLSSGMAFPDLEVGPTRARVQSAHYRLAGRKVDIAEISKGEHSLRFIAQPQEPGVATFWVVLPPKDIKLKPEQVAEYLEEIAAPAALLKQWADMKPQRWRELYTKHQKTFVRVGTPPADDRSWGEPVGAALEIVPEQDPTVVRVAGEFAVRVLKNGKPFAGFPLNAVAGGETKGETRKTDAEGRVSFAMKKAGPWLFRGTDVRRSTRVDADWESDFVTLTLEARPK